MINRDRHGVFVALLGLSASPSLAQPTCHINGPDAMIGDIYAASNYRVVAGVDAFSFGTSLCNIGGEPIPYSSDTNQHPIITQGMYRLRVVNGATRLEQVGLSWCFHTFIALSTDVCCPDCIPTNGSALGVHCADQNVANTLGSQVSLGPRRQINAANGFFTYPPANPAWSGSAARRLQVHLDDLDPQVNPGARYFVEHTVVTPGDAAAGNTGNNATHRAITITAGTDETGFNAALDRTGAVAQRGRPAILAWQDADPAVVVTTVHVPGDGIFLVAGRATRIASATWRYEYAVHNLSSDRSGRGFRVPYAQAERTFVRNFGFHDVDYHSGDGGNNVNFDGTDWPANTSAGAVTWSTQTFEANPNANALRWATLYNFRLDSNIGPAEGVGEGAVSLQLFKPGTPASVVAEGLPVPRGAPCTVDWNADGVIGSQDFFAFLTAFFVEEADFNGDGATNSQDLFDFLTGFFGGC